jgi:hypothetical protein
MTTFTSRSRTARSWDQGKPPRQPACFVGALKKKQAQEDELVKGAFR